MKDNSFSIHERNIQSLAIEIYKFLNGLSPSFLNNVFHKNISNSYDLRNHKELYSRNLKTVRYGTENLEQSSRNYQNEFVIRVFFKQKYANGNQNAIAVFVQHICTMLVLLMLFSFYLFWFCLF